MTARGSTRFVNTRGGGVFGVSEAEASARTIRDPREGARWMVERAAAARRAGLDSLFVGDHHATRTALA